MALTRQEYLLICLGEECDEVGQRVTKALRFGLSEVQHGQPLNNGDRITGGSVTLNAGSLPVIRRRLLRVLLEHHVERGL